MDEDHEKTISAVSKNQMARASLYRRIKALEGVFPPVGGPSHRYGPAEKAGEYQRAIYRMKYDDQKTLQRLLYTVANVNAKASIKALITLRSGIFRDRLALVAPKGEDVVNALPEGDARSSVEILLKEVISAASPPAPLETNGDHHPPNGGGGETPLDAGQRNAAVLDGTLMRTGTPHGGWVDPDDARVKYHLRALTLIKEFKENHPEVGEGVMSWMRTVEEILLQWQAAEDKARAEEPPIARLIGLDPTREWLTTANFGNTRSSLLDPTDDPQQQQQHHGGDAEEEEWVDPNSLIIAHIPKLELQEVASDLGDVPLTPRTILRTKTAAGEVYGILKDNAAEAEIVLGRAGEVGLGKLADHLKTHRKVAMMKAPNRFQLFEAERKLTFVFEGLCEAAEKAAMLELLKKKKGPAKADEAEMHERQKEIARQSAIELNKLLKQIKLVCAVRAEGVAEAIAGELPEDAKELTRLRAVAIAPSCRQELEIAALQCGELAGRLKGTGKFDDAVTAVEALEAQLSLDASEARVAFKTEENFISGFHILDGENRVVVLEGLHQGSLRYDVLNVCPKPKAGEVCSYSLLYNNRVSFKERFYAHAAFDVRVNGGVEVLRLDGGEDYGGALPLDQLLFSKESKTSKQLYYRGDPAVQGRCKFGQPKPAIVDATAYEALNLVANLQTQSSMWDVTTLGLFPTKSHLEGLHSNFSAKEIDKADEIGPDASTEFNPGESHTSDLLATMLRTEDLMNTLKNEHVRRKGPTIQDNPEFAKAKALWKAPDHIHKNIKAVEPLEPPLKAEKWWETETRPVFVYSGQRLQYTEWQKEQIRARASMDPENHYTYSQMYLSGSLCPVNEERLKEDADRLCKSKFITENGFVYPYPKKPEDFIKLDNAISLTRSEELKQPWKPQFAAKSNRGGVVKDEDVPETLQGREPFNIIPCFSGFIEKDTTNAWRSVHLGNDNRPNQTELKRKEMADWREKFVVDDAVVHVHRKGIQRARVFQTDRSEDIRKDVPKKPSLKTMPFPVEKMAGSLLDSKFPDKPQKGGMLARQDHPDKWVSPDNFQLDIDSRYKPYKTKEKYGEKKGGLLQIKHVVSTTRPLDPSEMRGSVWGS